MHLEHHSMRIPRYANGEVLRSSEHCVPRRAGQCSILLEFVKGMPLRGAVVTSGSESKSSVFASGVGLLTHDYARSLKQYRKTKLGTLSFICTLI